MPSQDSKSVQPSIRESEFFRELAQRLSAVPDEVKGLANPAEGSGQTETAKEDSDGTPREKS